MAKINGNEIRPGNVIEHDGGLWVAVFGLVNVACLVFGGGWLLHLSV